MQGEVPERCTPEVMHTILAQHLESPTMWTIFALQARGCRVPVFPPDLLTAPHASTT